MQKLQAYADIYMLGAHQKPGPAPITPSAEQTMYKELLTQLLPLVKNNLRDQESKAVTFDDNSQSQIGFIQIFKHTILTNKRLEG